MPETVVDFSNLTVDHRRCLNALLRDYSEAGFIPTGTKYGSTDDADCEIVIPNDIIFNDLTAYVVGEELGQGSNGKVYSCKYILNRSDLKISAVDLAIK